MSSSVPYKPRDVTSGNMTGLSAYQTAMDKMFAPPNPGQSGITKNGITGDSAMDNPLRAMSGLSVPGLGTADRPTRRANIDTFTQADTDSNSSIVHSYVPRPWPPTNLGDVNHQYLIRAGDVFFVCRTESTRRTDLVTGCNLFKLNFILRTCYGYLEQCMASTKSPEQWIRDVMRLDSDGSKDVDAVDRVGKPPGGGELNRLINGAPMMTDLKDYVVGGCALGYYPPEGTGAYVSARTAPTVSALDLSPFETSKNPNDSNNVDGMDVWSYVPDPRTDPNARIEYSEARMIYPHGSSDAEKRALRLVVQTGFDEENKAMAAHHDAMTRLHEIMQNKRFKPIFRYTSMDSILRQWNFMGVVNNGTNDLLATGSQPGPHNNTNGGVVLNVVVDKIVRVKNIWGMGKDGRLIQGTHLYLILKRRYDEITKAWREFHYVPWFSESKHRPDLGDTFYRDRSGMLQEGRAIFVGSVYNTDIKITSEYNRLAAIGSYTSDGHPVSENLAYDKSALLDMIEIQVRRRC
jgi:hypothetical protein